MVRVAGKSSLTDAMSAYVAGDMKSFRVVHLRIRPIIRGMLRSFSPHTADEIEQLVWLKAHANRSVYRSSTDQNVKNWFRSIARNEILNAVRSRSRARARLASVENDPTQRDAWGLRSLEGPADAVMRKESKRLISSAVESAMSSISERDRLLLISHHCDGRSFQELEERLQVPSGTLRVRAWRARSRLEQVLQSSGPEGIR